MGIPLLSSNPFISGANHKKTCSSQAGWGEDTQVLLSPFLLFPIIIKVTQKH